MRPLHRPRLLSTLPTRRPAIAFSSSSARSPPPLRPFRRPTPPTCRYRPYTTRPSIANRNAADPVAFLVAVAIVSTGTYLFSEFAVSPKQPSAPATSAAPDKEMAAPTPQDGHVGHLTPEQESKLKDFWRTLFELLAVPGAEKAPSPDGAAAAESSPTPSKRKSRLGRLFGYKEDGAGDDADDKHGVVKEFREALAKQTPEEMRAALWSMLKADNPDAVLLRFLRARDWDVHAALVMLISAIHWRSAEMHVDDEVMRKGEAGYVEQSTSGTGADKQFAEDFMFQVRKGKSYLHGVDNQNRPINVVRARLHVPGKESERSLEQYTLFFIETGRLLLVPPVETATIIFDMTGFSMANMDYSPVKFMIKCFEANYPESLGNVLIYRAPWIFQGIWKIIRGWLDPVVAAKIHFCSDEAALSEYIDRDRIPKEMGGTDDWEFEYVEPREGENAAMKDVAGRDKIVQERKAIAAEFEAQTIRWFKEGVKPSDAERRGIAAKLRENYWRLDPHVRARSLIDRVGVLKPGGVVDFDAEKGKRGGAAAAEAEAVQAAPAAQTAEADVD